MPNIDKATMREKLDIAEFYADAMSGKVRELRVNTATICTPFGPEKIPYWQLRQFKAEREQQYQDCLNGVRKVFNKLKELKLCQTK